jgi:uncharacterized protein involved in response to NO
MSSIPLGASPAPRPVHGWAPFALGFRPFFLLAAGAALALMMAWLPMWIGQLEPVRYYGLIGWHSHEMLFGYASAVIAGFLLTATRNWTGIATLNGRPLAALCTLWLFGRALPFAYPSVPGALVAGVDALFLPALIWALARPLWRGANKINRGFLPLLAAMTVANLLIHAEALGLLSTSARAGQDLMLNLVLLLITWIGGRVMPFFTETAVTGSRPRRRPRLEQAAFVAFILYILLDLSPLPNWLLAVSALSVAVTQAWRLLGWHHPGVWRIPILWVLYSGFAWLIVGFILQALAALQWFAPNLAMHALTVGGVGVLTLGMMSRVALGHSGRELRTALPMNIAFGLLNLGALTRVLAPALLPGAYTGLVHLAGGLWLLAFFIFSLIYTPILLRARADGRPG